MTAKSKREMSETEQSPCRYALFTTTLGWMGILFSSTGIRRITMPQQSPLEALDQMEISDQYGEPDMSNATLRDLVRRLEGFFMGEKPSFSDALDLEGTSFQKSVWEMVRSIPYGETRSYGWVAQQIGRPGAARAVGQAMRANPVSIIVPCHRVIGANGDLCGYGGSGGVEIKRWLLDLESGSVQR